jgi:hypothetical protein
MINIAYLVVAGDRSRDDGGDRAVRTGHSESTSVTALRAAFSFDDGAAVRVEGGNTGRASFLLPRKTSSGVMDARQRVRVAERDPLIERGKTTETEPGPMCGLTEECQRKLRR